MRPMIMHPRHLIFAAAIAPISLIACATSSPDDEDIGVSEGALGEPETRGFVTPSLALADEERVFAASYRHLDPGRVIPDNLLFDTIAYFDANKTKLKNKGHVAVVDFSKHSGKKRFYMIDMRTGVVTPHMVAHGSGSEAGNGYANTFSDTDGSHMSSLGFVVTGSTCDSSHGRALLLYGLSRSNAHMRSREIIIHSATYVSETSSRQGNSWGCFALDPRIKDPIINELQDGALMYAALGKPNVAAARPGAGVAPTTPDTPAATPTTPTTPAGPPPREQAACATDGDCNPGNDGSGLICVTGVCVPGCHQNSHCPGSTTCEAGTCQ